MMKKCLLAYVTIILLWSCGPSAVQHEIRGETMGTYYDVRYMSASPIVTQEILEALLADLNDQLSTYIPTSTISIVNSSDGEIEIPIDKRYFIDNFMLSDDLYQLTDGAFDPTVMPLVNYWGFGYEPKRAVTEIDSQRIEEIMHHVGWDRLDFLSSPDGLSLDKGSIQLDMSAIAKGYAIDVIGEMLHDLGLHDYKVEIGGEVLARGHNAKGKPWVLGVSRPRYDAEERDFVEYVALSNAAMASSGNYRNYHEVDGRRYGHTINPHTGYPELNDLLAVTVIADDCAIADALATACMTLGSQRALYLIDDLKDVSACFFTSGDDGDIIKTYSDGFIQHVYSGD